MTNQTWSDCIYVNIGFIRYYQDKWSNHYSDFQFTKYGQARIQNWFTYQRARHQSLDEGAKLWEPLFWDDETIRKALTSVLELRRMIRQSGAGKSRLMPLEILSQMWRLQLSMKRANPGKEYTIAYLQLTTTKESFASVRAELFS